MNRRSANVILILTLLLALTGMPEASAKGPFQRVLISSPALDDEIVVDDPMTLWFLSMTGLVDLLSDPLAEVPEDAAEIGYELQRQYEHSAGVYQTFDRVRYHPSVDGGPGYVYMVGMDNGWYEYQDRWYTITPEGETTLQAVLAEEQVRCPVTGPTTDHQVSDEPLIGSGSFWLSITLPADESTIEPVHSTRDIEAANATGSLFVAPNITGDVTVNLYEVGTFSVENDVSAFARLADGSARPWQSTLLIQNRVPAGDDFARYDWEAYFPARGCYELIAWADNQQTRIYIDVE